MQIRFVLAVALALATGWYAHSVRPVQAADAIPTKYELQGSGPATTLSLYDANDHRIYVYQGVAGGNSTVYCSYSLHVPRASGPVERTNCPVGSLR